MAMQAGYVGDFVQVLQKYSDHFFMAKLMYMYRKIRETSHFGTGTLIF